MMTELECTIKYSANTGIAVRFGNIGGSSFTVDAFHDHNDEGYSSVSAEMLNIIKNDPDFADTDAVLFTHCHDDHFGAKAAEMCAGSNENALWILPEKVRDRQILLNDDIEVYRVADMTITCIRLPHSGEMFSNVRHYGYLVECEGIRILIPGDCDICSTVLQKYLSEVPQIDVAVLNFPWIALPRGRRFVKTFIKPKHIIVVHLPFEEDDRHDYRKMLARQVERCNFNNIRIMSRPLQNEYIVR